MQKYCTVRNCPHPGNHNSLSHPCSWCAKFGHECWSLQTPQVLTIPKEKQCTIENCAHKATHTKAGHLCRLCKNYGHGFKECLYTTAENIAGTRKGKIYVITYEGMGGLSFHRRHNARSEFEVFHMTQTCWGQYGFSKIPALEKFLEGYTPLRAVDASYKY